MDSFNDKQLNRLSRKVQRTRKKWLSQEMKLLNLCVKHMNCIGNNGDKDELKELITIYDQHVALIEKEFISKIRGYIK